MVFIPRSLRTLVVCVMLGMAASAAFGWQADRSPPRPMSERITHEVREILIRHGMPIEHEGDNPWFSMITVLDLIGTGEQSFLLYLDRVDEVPLAARVEIIEYCMRLHEASGRHQYLRLQMRSTPRQATLLRARPDFELVFNDTH